MKTATNPKSEPYLVKAYLRRELEALLPASSLGYGPFTKEEIEAELERRDIIEAHRRDFPKQHHA